LTGFIPADLAARLLRLLDGGPELVGTQAARIGNAIDPNGPATPALAVLVLGWLEAAAQVLAAAGSSSQELQVLLSLTSDRSRDHDPGELRRSTTGCSPARPCPAADWPGPPFRKNPSRVCHAGVRLPGVLGR
jgi:hypothetical protein